MVKFVIHHLTEIMQIHCRSVICCKTSGRETTRLFCRGVPTSDAWMHIPVWRCCLMLCYLPCVAPKSKPVASPRWFEQTLQCPKLNSHDLLLAAIVINQWFRYWLSLFWLLQPSAWAARWFSCVARAPVSWGGSWNHHSQFGDFFGDFWVPVPLETKSKASTFYPCCGIRACCQLQSS